MWHDPSDSVEPPEGQEVSGPDHWVDPVLTQLWNGHFFSNHKQEPTVQVGEGDQNLHHPAMQRNNVPLQGEVQITFTIGDTKKGALPHFSMLLVMYLSSWSRQYPVGARGNEKSDVLVLNKYSLGAKARYIQSLRAEIIPVVLFGKLYIQWELYCADLLSGVLVAGRRLFKYSSPPPAFQPSNCL